MPKPTITTARTGRILVESKFRNYDLCVNPYVGCEFGCRYCYVRFFVKDKDKEWGEFVRRRDHIVLQLPKDLGRTQDLNTKRIVLGTLTDPYQPLERKARLTRNALAILAAPGNRAAKVGIFSRSPIVLDDIDLIRRLPNPNVHVTLTPYPRQVLRKIEPIPVLMERRLRTIETLTATGDIYVHANVSPVLPIYSEQYTEELAKRLADSGIKQFYVDPMMMYKPALEALDKTMGKDETWLRCRAIVTDKDTYRVWKMEYGERWLAAWRKYGNNEILAIYMDHERHQSINMQTGQPVAWTNYDEHQQEQQQA